LKRFVLDASVALGWFIDSPMPPYSIQVRQTLLRGARAVVPAIWHLEMANGLVVAERRRILTATEVSRCLTNLERLLAQAIETSSGFTTMRQVLTTARAFQLSAYDAAYLDTARGEELHLATLDKSLRAAAESAGVELLL
jgi:predicted nucleic acid-binding protein